MMKAYLIWFIASAIFVFLEIFVPGGIIVFLGLSGLLVSALLYFEFIDSAYMAFIVWFISSICMILFLRSFFMKYFEGDTSKQEIDEDKIANGMVALVTKDILPEEMGRIRFRDTTWGATSEDSIKEGENAIIIKQDGINWIVKKENS